MQLKLEPRSEVIRCFPPLSESGCVSNLSWVFREYGALLLDGTGLVPKEDWLILRCLSFEPTSFPCYDLHLPPSTS